MNSQLNLVQHILQAHRHGWSDLIDEIDKITQAFAYSEYNRPQLKEKIVEWENEVSARSFEHQQPPFIPSLPSELLFGTEV